MVMATNTTEKETVVLETLRAEPGITEIELAERVRAQGVKRLDTILKSLRNKRLIVSPPGFGLMAVDNGDEHLVAEPDTKPEREREVIAGQPGAVVITATKPVVNELEKRTAKREAKKRKPKEGTPCLCDCGQITKGGAFRPGHDVRFHSKLKAGVIPVTEQLLARVAPFIVAKPIIGRVSEAKKPRVCDEKCSLAVSHKCNCACGGANHQQMWKQLQNGERPAFEWDDEGVGE